MNRLADKTAIVTGGAAGIGRACVIRLSEEGSKVAVFDRDKAGGRALVNDLTAKGHDVAFWAVDVTNEAALKAAIDAVAARFGGPHVMVNNVGVSCSPKPTDQVTEAERNLVKAVNVKGVLFGTNHAIPHFRCAGAGSIINQSSIARLIGIGCIAPHHASKVAVRLMTKKDAITHASEKTRANSIHPAYDWTPMVENHLRATTPDSEVAKAAAGAADPVGITGEPDNVAWAVVWLVSDKAKFVARAAIVIDDDGDTAR